MVLASFAVVRKKAGDRDPAILSDDDINEAIQASDSFVSSILGKFNWEVSDPGYYSVKEISELFAAADLLHRYQDTRDAAKEELELAKYKLDLLKNNFPAATGNEERTDLVTIVPQEYHTFPSNPVAGYKRPFGRGSYYESIEHFKMLTGDL